MREKLCKDSGSSPQCPMTLSMTSQGSDGEHTSNLLWGSGEVDGVSEIASDGGCMGGGKIVDGGMFGSLGASMGGGGEGESDESDVDSRERRGLYRPGVLGNRKHGRTACTFSDTEAVGYRRCGGIRVSDAVAGGARSDSGTGNNHHAGIRWYEDL